MSEEPALGYGVSGWKGRQERARMKHSHGKTPEEKAAIRQARKQLYEQQAKATDKAKGEKPKDAPAVEVPPVGDNPEFSTGSAPKTFDLSGNWMAKRAEVKETLGLEKSPASKAAARELLENAGYEVVE